MSRARLKAVASCSARSINSPATRSELFRARWRKDFSPFEHMDNSNNTKPSTLKGWQSKIKEPPTLKSEANETQSNPESNIDRSGKICLIGILSLLI